jgi:hypothetical protein
MYLQVDIESGTELTLVLTLTLKTGDAPASSGVAPASSGVAPASSGVAPASGGDAPVTSGVAPASSVDAPAASSGVISDYSTLMGKATYTLLEDNCHVLVTFSTGSAYPNISISSHTTQEEALTIAWQYIEDNHEHSDDDSVENDSDDDDSAENDDDSIAEYQCMKHLCQELGTYGVSYICGDKCVAVAKLEIDAPIKIV